MRLEWDHYENQGGWDDYWTVIQDTFSLAVRRRGGHWVIEVRTRHNDRVESGAFYRDEKAAQESALRYVREMLNTDLTAVEAALAE